MNALSACIVSLFIASVGFSAPARAMGRGSSAEPNVVQAVDLDRYAGDWHEIAHAPNWFQSKCMQSLAHYEKLDDAHVSVFNTCYKKNGGVSTIRGYATIPDSKVPAKLLVRFKILGLFPVKGDYWIVDLGKDYDYAVVSDSVKKSLFILSREAPMPREKLDVILNSLSERGFRVDNLFFDHYAADAEK